MSRHRGVSPPISRSVSGKMIPSFSGRLPCVAAILIITLVSHLAPRTACGPLGVEGVTPVCFRCAHHRKLAGSHAGPEGAGIGDTLATNVVCADSDRSRSREQTQYPLLHLP